MKHGKRPTRKQCELFYKCGLSPDEWLVVKNQPGRLVAVNRRTRETRELWKTANANRRDEARWQILERD